MVRFKRNTCYLQHWSGVVMALMPENVFSFRSKKAAYRDYIGGINLDLYIWQGRLDIGSPDLCKINKAPEDHDQGTALAFSSEFSNLVIPLRIQ